MPDIVLDHHRLKTPIKMKYKVTIAQTAGTLRSFPYGFVLEVLGSL